ncbi:DUF1439 domain-containing protein [Pasteurellaceae bacterium HPA106]|uniref:DUF1439 domain-containing protein n=1 Tax=Spirabiliibacterium pneumoniae TaxID=221400 RepID=UPI001AAD55BB|nr:DUF1439 domain-containing protein [Spirabiliibacterium pneumoniae]MBE2895324.1 DUF1439 domain-containing protein [Spirabiliibacterium pneumoniae]
MRRIQKAFFTIFALFLPLLAHAGDFRISEAQINHYLSEKFGYNDDFSIPMVMKMHYQVDSLQAKVGINDGENVQLDGAVSANIQFQGQNIASQIKLTFDVTPVYNAEQGSVYLKNLRVLRWSSQPDRYAAQLQTIMPLISNSLELLLNQFPVYTLDPNDSTQSMIKAMVKKLRIEPGNIVLETGVPL